MYVFLGLLKLIPCQTTLLWSNDAVDAFYLGWVLAFKLLIHLLQDYCIFPFYFGIGELLSLCFSGFGFWLFQRQKFRRPERPLFFLVDVGIDLLLSIAERVQLVLLFYLCQVFLIGSDFWLMPKQFEHVWFCLVVFAQCIQWIAVRLSKRLVVRCRTVVREFDLLDASLSHSWVGHQQWSFVAECTKTYCWYVWSVEVDRFHHDSAWSVTDIHVGPASASWNARVWPLIIVSQWIMLSSVHILLLHRQELQIILYSHPWFLFQLLQCVICCFQVELIALKSIILPCLTKTLFLFLLAIVILCGIIWLQLICRILLRRRDDMKRPLHRWLASCLIFAIRLPHHILLRIVNCIRWETIENWFWFRAITFKYVHFVYKYSFYFYYKFNFNHELKNCWVPGDEWIYHIPSIGKVLILNQHTKCIINYKNNFYL